MKLYDDGYGDMMLVINDNTWSVVGAMPPLYCTCFFLLISAVLSPIVQCIGVYVGCSQMCAAIDELIANSWCKGSPFLLDIPYDDFAAFDLGDPRSQLAISTWIATGIICSVGFTSFDFRCILWRCLSSYVAIIWESNLFIWGPLGHCDQWE